MTTKNVDPNYTIIMQELISKSTQQFTSLYTREDLLQNFKEARAAKGTTKYESRIRARLLNILDSCHELIPAPIDLQMIKREIRNNHQLAGIFDDWLFGLTEEEFADLIDSIPTREELIQSLFKELHSIYQMAPTPQEYMRRLVLRLADEDLIGDGDSVRLIILKQFLRHTQYKTRPIFTLIKENLQGDQEFLIQNVTDELFDVLLEMKEKFEAEKGTDKKAKDKFKDAKRRVALLQLADDLATGKYRTNGRTKTDLYMFAMAFGMTVNLGEEQYDLKKDVEKNLFHDYYNDNLLRYLMTEYQEESTGFEAEPTGEGINYKNFAEAIYLYYIHKNDLSPADKIKRSEKAIEQCVRQIKDGKVTAVKTSFDDSTVRYKNLLINEILNLKEEELVDHLCSHFYFPENIHQISKISAAAHQKTAMELFHEVMEDIEMLDGGIGFDEEEFEVLYDIKNFDFSINFDLLVTGFEEDSDFVKILQKLDDKLRDIGKKGLEQLEEKDKITRTQLIGLCYYYYRIGLDEEAKLSLPEIVDEFCDLVNPYLEQARFQTINEKNIFDMFIIFALYLEQIRYHAIDEKEVQLHDLMEDMEKMRGRG